MEIIVNAHTIQLTQTEIVNEGEYNIQKCNFTFSEEYNELTKIAIFSNLNNSFQTMITNDSCIIPAEILQQEGTLILGVYGYEVDGETLKKRYSPTPACFTVSKGSYQLASEVEPPSPSIVEQLEEQINDLSDEITTINNIISTLALKSEIPTKTSQLTNDSGFIDKNVNDLTNYTKTNDLSAVATSGDYDDLSNKPTIPTKTSELTNDDNFVKNTDYASDNTAGVIKVKNNYGLYISSNGELSGRNITYSQYENANSLFLISKVVLENVITGKDLTTKAYVDGLVGDIGTALDEINGEIVGGV